MSNLARRSFFGFAAAAPFAAASAVAAALAPQGRHAVTLDIDRDFIAAAIRTSLEQHEKARWARVTACLGETSPDVMLPSMRYSFADDELGTSDDFALDRSAAEGSVKLSLADNSERPLHCDPSEPGSVTTLHGDQGVEKYANHCLAGHTVSDLGGRDRILVADLIHNSVSVGSGPSNEERAPTESQGSVGACPLNSQPESAGTAVPDRQTAAAPIAPQPSVGAAAVELAPGMARTHEQDSEPLTIPSFLRRARPAHDGIEPKVSELVTPIASANNVATGEGA